MKPVLALAEPDVTTRTITLRQSAGGAAPGQGPHLASGWRRHLVRALAMPLAEAMPLAWISQMAVSAGAVGGRVSPAMGSRDGVVWRAMGLAELSRQGL